MQRSTGPWGFSIEGGRGSEYFAGDPSIVVTGIAPNTPAMSSLRYITSSLILHYVSNVLSGMVTG